MNATPYILCAIALPVLAVGLASVAADIFRAIFPPRNRRKWGTKPRDERGAFLRSVPAIQARKILAGNSRKGWRTRRGNQATATAAQMDADVRRILAAEGVAQ
jgi:hypothetical protein